MFYFPYKLFIGLVFLFYYSKYGSKKKKKGFNLVDYFFTGAITLEVLIGT